MITLQDLEKMHSHLKMLDYQRKFYENQQVTAVLQYFGIPDHKSESIKSIADYLEFDIILIYMPNSVYDTIDFSKLFLPEKLKFIPNGNENDWFLLGKNRLNTDSIEIKFNP